MARSLAQDGKMTLAERLDARFFELVLDIDAATLAGRLARRASEPDRPEHLANNRHAGPDDAQRPVESMEAVLRARPGAVRIDARGSRSSTLDLMRAALVG